MILDWMLDALKMGKKNTIIYFCSVHRCSAGSIQLYQLYTVT